MKYNALKKYINQEYLEKSIDNKTNKIEYKKQQYQKVLNRILQIQEYITPELRRIKQIIEKQQSLGKKVAIVCLTGDLPHPGHIIYIKTAREKIKRKFNLKDDDLFLIVGLETQSRTIQRKGKKPILTDEERKYQWKHFKGVDESFIWNIDINLYPSDLMLYLTPNFWVSHEEYFDLNKYLRVSRKLKYGTNNKTKAIIVRFDEPDKFLPEGDVRNKWGLSTTNIVGRMLENYKDILIKKYPDKLIKILQQIDTRFIQNFIIKNLQNKGKKHNKFLKKINTK